MDFSNAQKLDFDVQDFEFPVPRDRKKNAYAATLSPFSEQSGMVCFAAGTQILTPRGEIPIEYLRPGDLVQTRDNGIKPIVWAGSKTLDANTLSRAPYLKPISLSRGVINSSQRMLVSPLHGVVMRRRNGDEYLVRAMDLACMPGGKARVAEGIKTVTYVHIMFDQHEIMFANAAPAESFYPTETTLHAMDQKKSAEIYDLFPALQRNSTLSGYGEMARPMIAFNDLPEHERALGGW